MVLWLKTMTRAVGDDVIATSDHSPDDYVSEAICSILQIAADKTTYDYTVSSVLRTLRRKYIFSVNPAITDVFSKLAI